MKLLRARDAILYICVLYSFICIIYAFKHCKSNRRLIHNTHTSWKSRHLRRCLSSTKRATETETPEPQSFPTEPLDPSDTSELSSFELLNPTDEPSFGVNPFPPAKTPSPAEKPKSPPAKPTCHTDKASSPSHKPPWLPHKPTNLPPKPPFPPAKCTRPPVKTPCPPAKSSNPPSKSQSPTTKPTPRSRLSPHDPSSYSRPDQAIITHISMCLNVDFKRQALIGKAILTFYVMEDIQELILDVNCLRIESIETSTGYRMEYGIEGETPEDRTRMTIGSKLTITLPMQASTGDDLKIVIKYATDPAASALTWLKPFQTTGMKHPYLFSQSSPIHARSILPCQDTPTVRFTYDAEITAPEDLTVLMSALKGPVKRNNKSVFHQPVPIPSTLIAIAVGKLEYRTIGPRSKVWAEEEDVERCAAEFAETEKYLYAAEKLCGPYDWTTYDILVLPPAFSHGAMENPCLTFASPTVVVGDKSLVGVIMHEIMHSWTGNAVSIKNFEHFWLNEGFAVFLQRKVAASFINDTVKAKQILDMAYVLGLQELADTIDLMGPTHPYTKLVLKLDGVHPADAFSSVPYEKGSLFLRYLEDLLGGPKVFNKFIHAYVRQFSMQSVNSDLFKAFVNKRFKKNDKIKQIDWNTWFYSPGMPIIVPKYDRTLAKPVVCLVAKIQNPSYTFSYEDVREYNLGQSIYLLQLLLNKPPLSVKRLRALGSEYEIERSENKEIMSRWLRLCVRSKDESKLGEVFGFLNCLGRLSYVRPLYRELYAWEEFRSDTIKNFLENERYMPHITVYNLKKDLHLDT